VDRKPSAALTSPALHAQAPPMTRLAVPPPAPQELQSAEQDKLAQLNAGEPSVSSGAASASRIVAGKRAVAAAPVVPKAAAGPRWRAAGGESDAESNAESERDAKRESGPESGYESSH